MTGPFLHEDVHRSAWRRALDRLPSPRGMRRIRPTREGGIFFATAFAVAGAALNTGNNLLYLVFALMLGLVVLSGVLSEVAIQRVRVERRFDGRVFAGVQARGTWTVHNPRRWLPTLALRIEERIGPDAELASSRGPSLPWVPPRSRADRPGTWRFARRGQHRLRGVRVSTTWPLGILRKWYDLDSPLDVLVLPAPGTSVPRTQASTAGAREPTVPPPGSGAGDFRGLREHAPGEGLRAIHWRSTARLRRRMVGERHAETEPRLEVRVVFSTAPGLAERAEALERSISDAVATLLDAERSGAEVAVELPGVARRNVRSSDDRDAVLRRLAVLALPGAEL